MLLVLTVQELFIQYLSSEAENMVKLDRKPRRNVQYRDLANAVNRVDRLEFLEDTVPVTVPFGKIKRDAAAAQAKLRSGGTVGGDATTSGGGSKGRKAAGEGAASSKSKSRSSAGAPTAISSLMANGESGPGKKRQQVLSFSILNGEDSDAANSHGGSAGLTFRAAAPSTGVAAAAALAQAAAASGTTIDAGDDSDPGAQLEQDMQRAHNDDADDDSEVAVGRRDGTARFTVADVDMADN